MAAKLILFKFSYRGPDAWLTCCKLHVKKSINNLCCMINVRLLVTLVPIL